MIEITLNKGKYYVPATVEEVTVWQFRDVISKSKDLTDIQFLSKLGKIPEKELKKAPRNEVAFFLSQLADMFKDFDQIKEGDVPKEFKFNDITYPVPQDLGNKSYGQWSDFENLLKDIKGDDILNIYPYVVALYCIPKGEDYDYKVSWDRAKEFDDLSFVTAFRIVNFFLTIDSEFLNAINLFLKEETQPKKAKRSKETLQESGAVS